MANPPVDLDAVAELCMEIARVETSSGVDALLARAGSVLDAAQVVLWVGTGDELVPVMVHGEDAQSARPTPVRRDADQARRAGVASRGVADGPDRWRVVR